MITLFPFRSSPPRCSKTSLLSFPPNFMLSPTKRKCPKPSFKKKRTSLKNVFIQVVFCFFFFWHQRDIRFTHLSIIACVCYVYTLSTSLLKNILNSHCLKVQLLTLLCLFNQTFQSNSFLVILLFLASWVRKTELGPHTLSETSIGKSTAQGMKMLCPLFTSASSP